MPKQKQTIKEIEENTVKKLSWEMAERDEEKVARSIYRKKEIDGIYGLDQSGLLDGFYEWLQEWGVIERLKKIAVEEIQRVMVPLFQYIILYFLKTLFGVESICSLPRLLFANQGAMKLAGFNAYQIDNGICKRGEDKRKRKEKSGPICDDTLARNIVKIPLKIIDKFFNGIVKLVASKGFFPRYITVIIDPTDIRTTPKWEGCGMAVRPKRIKDKRGKWKEVEEVVWGWKLIVVFYDKLKIPLAAKLVKIEESEKKYTLEVIEKAQENLGKDSEIIRVVMDRGHLDGKTLWRIDYEGKEFVIPACSDMHVTADARGLAYDLIKRNGIPNKPGIKKLGAGEYMQVREDKVAKGVGKNQTVEKKRTVVIGIKGLTTYDQYGSEGFAKDRHKKSFKGNKINVVVVVEWEGKNYGSEYWVVYLTDMKIYKPLKVFDEYDRRSIIENSLFKEGKQGWFIKHAPQKIQRALKIHVFFTLAVFALTNAYRRWRRDNQIEDEEDSLLGIRRWREKVNMQAKDKCLVFIGNHYGIFWMAEVMVLLGVKVKDIPKKVGKRKQILARYELKTE